MLSIPKETDPKIRAAQVTALFSGAPLFWGLGILAAGVFCYVSWDVIKHVPTIIWLSSLSLVYIVRLLFVLAFRRKDTAPSEARKWVALNIFLSFLTGAAWGSASLLLFDGSSVFRDALLGLLYASVIVGHIAGQHILLGSVIAFTTPITLLYTTRAFGIGGEYQVVLGLSLCIFWVLSLNAARFLYSARTSSLRLLERLKTEIGVRKKAEMNLRRAHDELEDRVQERTAALSQANKELCRLTNAIEQAAEAVLILSPAGNIQYTNPAAEKLIGSSGTELARTNLSLLIIGNDETTLSEVFAKTRGTHAPWNGEMRLVTQNEMADIEITVSPVLNVEDGGFEFIVIARDITQQKKLQNELLQTKRLSSLGALVAGIAHELNTPIATILGYSEELAGYETLPDEPRTFSRWIAQEAQRCADIVRSLLLFSRKQPSEKVVLELNKIIRPLVNMQRHAFAAKGLLLSTDFHDGRIMIVGDQSKLQQVFLNLITNAFYALTHPPVSDGELSITTRLVEGDAAVVEITNNGPAIPLDIIDRIFDPFFTTKPVDEGTGLGLSISYGIIQEHGGTIGVETRRPAGVCFRITLPLADQSFGRAAQAAMPPGAGARILLVKDDVHYLEWLKSVCRGAGLNTIEATNGAEAVAFLKDTDPALIISDTAMPEIDGCTLAQWISNEKPQLLDRLILLSEKGTGVDHDFCDQYYIELLPKSVTKTDLLKCIYEKILSNEHKNISCRG